MMELFAFYGQPAFREILAVFVVQNPLDGALHNPDQRQGVGVQSGEDWQGSSNRSVEPQPAAWARWLYTDGSREICPINFACMGREKRKVGRCEALQVVHRVSSSFRSRISFISSPPWTP